MDPFSLLLIAQSAVSAIRAGCDMLKEGTAVINDFKCETEGVVSQVRETVETVTGLWSWAKDLLGFSDKPQESHLTDASVVGKQEQTQVLPAKKTKKRAPPPDAELLQMQIVHDVSQQLGKFFDIQQQITNHYKDLEEASLHVYEAKQNHAMKAIERVEVELQLEELTKKIRETMVYAPAELKDLYTRFLRMYGKIKEEQEFARQEQLQKARTAKDKKWQQRNDRIDLASQLLGVTLGLIWIWSILGGILLLTKTRGDFWLG